MDHRHDQKLSRENERNEDTMTAATELTSMTLVELRDAIAGGAVSAEQATKAYFEQIAARNDELNCYRELYEERAMQRARAVDQGETKGPLAGVPLGLKDIFCTTFGKTTCSSRMLEQFASPYDATVVERLEAAGAIILGKTNMDEFAMGSSTENCAFGSVRNPHNTEYVPGGSSGGSAAAIAAGLCAGAIGTDTGGSIRQPAAYCGVVGLKPTYGRISRWGMVAFASSLDQAGPLTRTVGDAALLLSVMAGADARDSTCADAPVPEDLANVDQTPERLRIGIAKQYLSERNSPALQRAVDEAIAVYRDAGAELVEVDLPHTEYGIPTYYLVATAEASSNLARYDGVHYGHRSSEASELIDLYARSRSEGFGPEFKRRIMLGTFALSAGY
ncbi:MAG: aspartyl/glutamyl-tRNA amidotransferase subunit A, partial [Rhodospirillales bacterium]|nr:aspartyl/glutamyl-tRNA amidotransferase subunit A [Rhodospirillales bacterium]